MGKRNTFNGYIRLRGVGSRLKSLDGPAPVPVKCEKKFAVADASQAAGTLAGLVLPKGAIVTGIQSITNVTGGTTPTINIGVNFRGSAPDDGDGLVANLDVAANAVVDVTNGGVLFGVVWPEDGEITVGAGTGTPGTGGVDLIIEYTFDDDGAVND